MNDVNAHRILTIFTALSDSTYGILAFSRNIVDDFGQLFPCIRCNDDGAVFQQLFEECGLFTFGLLCLVNWFVDNFFILLAHRRIYYRHHIDT